MRNSVRCFVAAASFVALTRVDGQQPIYVEAENAQFSGNWIVESRTEAFNGACLLSDNSGGGKDAVLVLAITNAGTYNVWVRSRDFDTYTGQRRFQVGMDGVLFPFVAGAHGTNGFWWENVGSRALTAADHALSLHDISNFYPRADAFFLTTNATNPNQLSYAQLAAYQVTLRTVPFRRLDSPTGIMLRFSSASDVTNNLRALATTGSTLAYYGTNAVGLLRFTATLNNGFASAVYDTAPGDGAATNSLFGNVSVSADVRFGTSQQSFGFLTRIPATEDNGHLVLVNCDPNGAGSSDTYRVFGAGSNPQTTDVSTNVLLQVSTNALVPAVWYTFRLTVKNTGNGGATFTLDTINRTNGILIASETATASSGALTSPGEIGLRFYSTYGGTGQVIDLDNLSIAENPPDVTTNGTRTAVATLNGSSAKITFYSQPDIDGVTQITRDTAVLVSNSWVTVPFSPGAERLFLQYRSAANPNTSGAYITSWPEAVDFDLNGVAYTTLGTTEDPFQTADMEVLIPRGCRQVDAQMVVVTNRSLQGRTVVATWQLGPGGNDAAVTVALTADRTGYYSFGFAGFSPATRSQISFDLLPPLYQFQRLPAAPKILTSSVTPQPLALVQRTFSGMTQPVTFGVIAEPGSLSFEWPMPQNADYGFSLLNTDGTVQPALFAPVLGLQGSLVNTGARLTASWHVLAQAGDWKAGLGYASDQILGVTDYRQPYRASLTHALLNMIDLVKDDTASGWGSFLKGPFQIESENTVTQPSPLTFISLGLLTQDETLYQTRALPTLEFSLSRPRQHFATDVTANTPSYYVTTNTTKITIPSTSDGTAYWQGVHDLLARRNPWIATLALTNGNVRYETALPRWLEEMGQYRLSPSPALLQQIQSDCTNFINSEFLTAKTNQNSLSTFYHFGVYPFWWGLVDLYELTGNPTYLAYAEEGAFHTIAGVFSHPMPPPGNITANAGGSYKTNGSIYWKGPARYRLGYPRSAGDTPERSVPAWVVSPVGWSLEQPVTYYTTYGSDRAFNMQMMVAWAPHLLRLYRYTGRSIYQTYARNAIIGRFSNDPGYYVNGFTDMFHDPQYPYVGPDVSCFYYHHMQARLAFVIDYLMAQAETLSKGSIAFPWARQQGYVWFTDRIYGQAPGAMYDQTGLWPWFNRNAAQVDSEQVDYLLARGSDSFWVVLMNQANAAVTVHLTNAAGTLGIITSQPVKVYENDQARPDLAYSSPLSVSIPARRLVALRFTTQSRDVFPRAVSLTASPTNQTLPGVWGKMTAFRTRSPFGSDSLFVVLTGRPPAGATAKLLLDGATALTKTNYPYEFSVYPWPMNQDLRFSLQLVDSVTNNSTPVVLAGTTNTPSTAYDDWKTAHGLPTNAPDWGDSDGDGWCNLLEYAFKMDPQAAAAPPPPAYATDGATFRLSYVKWRSDVTYFVEGSFDLQTWARQGVTETESGGTVTVSVPIAAAQARFLRLRVTYP